MVKNKNRDKLIMGGLAVLVIGLLLSSMGILNLSAFSVANGQLTTQPQAQDPSTVQTCEGSASLSLTYNIFDETPGNQTTSLNSDYNVVYYENGQYKGMVAAGTAITTVPNATLTLYAIDNDATHDVYGFSDVVTMGCASQTKAAVKGMQDSALTVAMYDISAGTDTENTATAVTALGAGEGIDAKWFVKASTSQARYGTTEGGAKALFVVDYNSLVYKQPIVTSVDGGTASIDVVPNGHVATAVTDNANTSVAYVITTNNLANLQNIQVYWQAEALTGSTNPDSNVGVTLYDSEMYQNDAGQWVVDFRDADSAADLGEANQTDLFYTS
jgi:hypothetical protein